jgi:hypothetical protein
VKITKIEKVLYKGADSGHLEVTLSGHSAHLVISLTEKDINDINKEWETGFKHERET